MITPWIAKCSSESNWNRGTGYRNIIRVDADAKINPTFCPAQRGSPLRLPTRYYLFLDGLSRSPLSFSRAHSSPACSPFVSDARRFIFWLPCLFARSISVTVSYLSHTFFWFSNLLLSGLGFPSVVLCDFDLFPSIHLRYCEKNNRNHPNVFCFCCFRQCKAMRLDRRASTILQTCLTFPAHKEVDILRHIIWWDNKMGQKRMSITGILFKMIPSCRSVKLPLQRCLSELNCFNA